MTKRNPQPTGDAFRSPLFNREEWRRIVATLMLSPRQADVVGLVMQSKSDKEIAATLGISIPTVRTHFNASKLRLNAIDRVAIACRMFETFRQLTEAPSS